MSEIVVIGIGPGARADLTLRAWDALQQADCIIGYEKYIQHVREWLPTASCLSSGITEEVTRCQMAIDEALKGSFSEF